MSKKGKKGKEETLPGPLAPWRMAIAVSVSALLTGSPLMEAATSGVEIDFALLRTFGVGFIVWIALGMINKMLVSATIRAIVAEVTGSDHNS